MRKYILKIIFFGLTVVYFNPSFSQDRISEEWNKMHQSKEQSLKEFNDAKFGMFIHWGLYSKPAGVWKGKEIDGLGEWIMYHAQIPRDEYREIAKEFNPVKFNAEEWVKTAKQAGMKYIVAMPKHHDGFAMYDSKVTDYDIIDATPFNRDPMKELYLECKKQGLGFGIYYSHSIDWMDGGDAGYVQKKAEDPNHTDSYGANLWDPSLNSYKEYLDTKAKSQMSELLDMFPDLFEIWYDFPRFMNKHQSFEFYKLAYEKQPKCIVNSRVGNGLGDFWIPGDNRIPKDEEAGEIFWETPGTLNNTWGIKSYDTDWKSIEELLYWITEITSKGGNYLLNVGPTAQGTFPDESVKQLKAIGEWMAINGESVYGTTKWRVNHEGSYNAEMKSTTDREKDGFNARITPEDFWFSKKEDVVYVTSLKWPTENTINIKSFGSSSNKSKTDIISVQMLGYEGTIKWKLTDDGLHVELPSFHPSESGYVLKVFKR